MQGQVLADLITQHPCVLIDDVAKLANNYASLQPWILSFDGSWTEESVGIEVAIISQIGRI